jgi:AbrB family looped-hinge helix DNA binding protein
VTDFERFVATVDADGRLVLPAEVASRLGLIPGTTVALDLEPDSVRLRRPLEQLAKVYMEPTSRWLIHTFWTRICRVT